MWCHMQELGEGLELVITHQTPTLAAAAKLVVAGSRWKKLLTGLSDDNLCSTVMGNLVEGRSRNHGPCKHTDNY